MKTLLKRNLVVIGMAFMLTSLSSSATPPQEKYIGLQLWSVREAMKENPQETIAKIGEMGYKFIEAAGYADGQFYGMEPVEFKALLNENGLDFLSSHTGQNVPDSAHWDQVMAWWDECIEAHSKAGVKYLVQPWMGERGFESLEGLQEYCDYFNAVGEKCNDKGIRFGFHNHAVEFEELEGEIIYDYMLKNTNPEKVMFQIDLYWVVEGGKDPVDYLTSYPGRFELWHVKDEAELGASGKMDFESMFALAEESGMEYIVVEVEKYNYDPLVSVEKSLQFLQDAPYVK